MVTPLELRVGVEALAGRAARELEPVWATFSTADAARDTLERVLPLLVRYYGQAAAVWAAQWYDADRAQARLPADYRARPVEVDDQGADVLARWGVDPLFAADPDVSATRELIVGGLQRRIANGARDTIGRNSADDRRAEGWQRVGTGQCDFCRMLIGRGAVYTEATVDFGAHDHCRCEAVPAWGGRPRPVQPYEDTGRPRNPADAARARRWIAEHL